MTYVPETGWGRRRIHLCRTRENRVDCVNGFVVVANGLTV